MNKLVKSTSFKVSVGVMLLAIFFKGNLLAQTLVSSPLTGTPVAGAYYSASQITIIPDFTFTATAGQSLSLYISACAPLQTSPSVLKNFIMTSIPRVPIAVLNPSGNTVCELMQNVDYLDGLGRPVQTVQVKANPDATKDIIQPVDYDSFGRESVKYLPFAYNGIATGSFRYDALVQQAQFYYPSGSTTASGAQQDNKVVYNQQPYARSIYENSPIGRLTEQGAPGEVWQPASGRSNITGRTVVMDYTSNNQIAFSSATSNNPGSRRVALYNVNSTGVLTRGTSAFYDSNQLDVTISKDENWLYSTGCFGTTEEYKDKEGRVVLKRTYNLKGNTAPVAEMLSTYYVYDDIGNLAFVLPPKSGADMETGVPSSTTIDNLCYQYKYDERNRLSRKRIPGSDWDYMVYNQLDQLVLSQNGVQRENNQWLVNKYDAIGRLIMSGVWNAGAMITQSTLQSSIYAGTQWDKRNSSDLTTGYTISSYPALTTVLTINYYDDYTGIPGKPAGYLPGIYSTSTKGLLTATKAAVLNSPATMLMTFNYYDDKGRVSTSYMQHYRNGIYNPANYDEVNSTYNFNDQLTSAIRKHYTYEAGQSNPVLALTLSNRYIYDHMGRRTESYQQTGTSGSPEVMLAKLEYNDVGQLKRKTLHGGIQQIDYAYNERGWLSKINEPTAPTPLKAFGMEFIYNTTGSSSQYNGNISQINWQTLINPAGADAGQQNYMYTYDKLNRMTLANYIKTGSVGKFDEEINYDPNGNIETLKRRNNTTGPYLNQLGYTYNNTGQGNQLVTVSDIGTAGQGGSYTYDANGNVKTDTRNLITGVTYNLLNLPQSVARTPGTITYYYDATGRKLRKVSGAVSRDYISGIEYNNGSIDFISTEEGRAIQSAGVYNYEYFLKDQLGNTRVTIKQDGAITQIQDYYAFGLDLNAGNNYQSSPTNGYKYNGKEKQDETGQYDYGARFYDPVIGRWGSVDPLAEEFRKWTPYNYVTNNPISKIDPDGTFSTDIDENGRVIKHTDDGDPSVYLHKDGKVSLVGYEDPVKTYKSGDQYTYYNPTTASNYNGQYLIPATAYNYSQGDIPNKGTQDWKYVKNGPGGFFNTVDRYADILRRDIYAPQNAPVVEESDDVATVFLGIVPLTAQAKQIISELNAGKNSVTIKTVDGQIRYDLDGAAHGGVPTPHKQIYKNRYVNGILKSITRESKKAQTLTQEEIRAIRKFLEK